MPEIVRQEKDRVVDFLKFTEEVKAMRNRLYNLDMTRLDEQYKAALETAVRNAEKRSKTGAADEVQRLQSEAKRYVDADHDRSKEILAAKFQKMDANIVALANFLQNLGSLSEMDVQLSTQEERLRKQDEELTVRRKVQAHETEELERDKKLLEAAEEAVSRKSRELDEKLKHLDVAARAKEMDQLSGDLDSKVKAYEGEVAKLGKDRVELNKDFDKLGEKRAEIEKEWEKLEGERRKFQDEKKKMADAVAREMAATFEAFVRDMLKPRRNDEDEEEE